MSFKSYYIDLPIYLGLNISENRKNIFFQVYLFLSIKANLFFLIFAWSEIFRNEIADSSSYSILLILFFFFCFDAACIKMMLICIKLLHASITLLPTSFYIFHGSSGLKPSLETKENRLFHFVFSKEKKTTEKLEKNFLPTKQQTCNCVKTNNLIINTLQFFFQLIFVGTPSFFLW